MKTRFTSSGLETQAQRWLKRCAALVLLAGVSLPSLASEAPHVRVELISSVETVAPGDRFDVILRQDIDEGWHTYWTNPGDSGAPPNIEWDVVDGVVVSEFSYPFPKRIPYGPLMNYGYKDEVLLPFTVTLDPSFAGQELVISGRGRVLVCADICIPQAVEVSLVLPVTDKTVSAGREALFERAESLVPVPINLSASYTSSDEAIELSIGLPGMQGNRIAQVDFFPYQPDLIDNPAPQSFRLNDEGLVLSLAAGWEFKPGESDLSGVIVVREGEGIVSSYAVQQGNGATSAGPSEEAPMGLLLAVAFAFLGGLILNLMPCVFPVLSIKILSLTESAAGEAATIRRHGWAYTAGVVGSFVAIALLLLALRAGGEAIGWGFQLQSPVVVALLAYLFVLIGLNLLGMFEFGTSIMQLGAGENQGHGYMSSVSTGVLATVVAAPCTAPFMGAAVGYALLQSEMTGLLVFASLGLGMAAPYLMLCYSPALLGRLPKPGAWMDTMRQALAFPMLASAVWLLWVLGIQAGATAMMQVLAGALTIAFAIWLYQKIRAKWIGATLASALVAIALYAAFSQEVVIAAEVSAGKSVEGGASPYSKAALVAAKEKGPVFVNFTAAWCITCKVNELNALEVSSVKAAFEDRGLTYLKADWTNEDPKITEALKQYGRSGVPLYLLYEKGADRATVLPQILTPSIVIDALDTLSD